MEYNKCQMEGLRPGYAFVVYQNANKDDVYEIESGLKQGTLFKELDKPIGKYGKEKSAYLSEIEVKN